MIAFLDIDGVLHPVFPRPELPDDENQLLSYLPRFEAVVREFPALQLVVASDWRKRHTLHELREFFSPDVRSRLVGITPLLARLGESHLAHRQREAMTWLAENNLVGVRWIALDDDPDNWDQDAPLVLCDDGFRDREESRLRELLG